MSLQNFLWHRFYGVADGDDSEHRKQPGTMMRASLLTRLSHVLVQPALASFSKTRCIQDYHHSSVARPAAPETRTAIGMFWNKGPVAERYSDHYETLLPCAITIFTAIGLPYLIHRLLRLCDRLVLSIRELLWRALVLLMPSQVLDHLSAIQPDTGKSASNASSAEWHDSKSERLHSTFDLGIADGLSRLWIAPKSSGVPPGLGNWDNSCYQNSVLQSLSSLRILAAYFDSTWDNHDGTTVQSLHGLLLDLNNPSNHGAKLWTPSLLKSMNSWQQQDAQEYYSKIIESVEKDITKARKNHPALTSSGLEELCSTRTNRNDTKQPQPHLQRRSLPLEGLLAQRVGCMRCGYVEGLSLIPFNCLTLSPGRAFECDLAQCLDEHTALETIDGVECIRCTLLQAQKQLVDLRQKLEDSKHDRDASGVTKTPGSTALEKSVLERAHAIDEALRQEDFTETTLKNKCQMSSARRVSSVKSKQATIMRSPNCLAIHINRSLYDEESGTLTKNYANVNFPLMLDLSPWCIGNQADRDEQTLDAEPEQWNMDPRDSMLCSRPNSAKEDVHSLFELRSIITHYGRHENGHYISYRKFPVSPMNNPELPTYKLGPESNLQEAWWRLSDEDVSRSSEEEVLSQGGAFMLFYERRSQSAIPSAELTLPATSTAERLTSAAKSIATEPLRGDCNAQQGRSVQDDPAAVVVKHEARSTIDRSSAPEMSPKRTGSSGKERPALRTAAPRRNRNHSETSRFMSLPIVTT